MKDWGSSLVYSSGPAKRLAWGYDRWTVAKVPNLTPSRWMAQPTEGGVYIRLHPSPQRTALFPTLIEAGDFARAQIALQKLRSISA